MEFNKIWPERGGWALQIRQWTSIKYKSIMLKQNLGLGWTAR